MTLGSVFCLKMIIDVPQMSIDGFNSINDTYAINLSLKQISSESILAIYCTFGMSLAA